MYEQPYNPFSRNLSIVKDYFKSGSVLALGVTRLIGIILSVAAALIGTNATIGNISSLSSYLQQFGFSAEEIEQSMRAFEQSGGTSLFSSLISAIPSVLIAGLAAAAFFIIYFKSRNEAPESSPKAGVMILYVFAVIQFILMIIAAVFTGLGFAAVIFILIAAGSQTSGSQSFYFDDPTTGQRQYLDVDPGVVTVFAIIVMVFTAAVIVFAMIYAVSKKRYYGSVKASITTVELQNRGAKAYGVFCVIFAVFAGLGLLGIPSSFLAIGSLNLDTAGIISLIVSALASIVAFVQLIFEAKVALGYKKYIDNVKYGYNNQPVGPYSPYNAPQGQVPYAAPNPPVQNANPYEPIRPETPSNPYADSYAAAPKAPTALVCPSCGSPVEPDITYCGNCGTKLK